jgi:predicted kinase
MADRFVEDLPADALILLVGPSGSGKSTWAAARFEPEAILSSDAFRAQVAGDAADQSATADAFKVLHTVVRARLRRGLLTIVDATNLTERARRALLLLAETARRPVVAVAFDVPLERCLSQNAARVDRQVPVDVIRRHRREMDRTLTRLSHEGYAAVHLISDDEMGSA